MVAIIRNQASAVFPFMVSNCHARSFFSGRKYHWVKESFTKEEEEFIEITMRKRSLKDKIARLESFVNTGHNINKVDRSGESILYRTLIRHNNPSHVEPVVNALFKLGVRVDFREYQEGSPLHDVAFYRQSWEAKVGAIHALVKNGMHVNALKKGNTPLDIVFSFQRGEENIKEVVKAFRSHGGVYGWGKYAPDRPLGADVLFDKIVMAVTKVISIKRTILRNWK